MAESETSHARGEGSHATAVGDPSGNYGGENLGVGSRARQCSRISQLLTSRSCQGETSSIKPAMMTVRSLGCPNQLA